MSKVLMYLVSYLQADSYKKGEISLLRLKLYARRAQYFSGRLYLFIS